MRPHCIPSLPQCRRIGFFFSTDTINAIYADTDISMRKGLRMALRSIADIEEKVAGAVSLYNTSVAESERIASVSLFGSYAKRLLMVSTHNTLTTN